MRPNEIEDDDEEEFRGPSKSHLKRVQLELQALGKEMTRMGDETLAKIGLPEEVLAEIIEFRRMKNFGAQRRQLQLIGKKMRDMDPAAVREAIARATGESRAAVALLHRCETLRDRMIDSDDAVRAFIDEHSDIDIRRLRELVRFARKEREAQKPPKSARELYRLLHDYLNEPLDLMAKDEDAEEPSEENER
ncbi:ribosome biogenesis factor YjgA [Sutterella sp.]|uniref:ribosome biogenesis factor YjgA n=1 Tax=Sutterella sp. TaxID=1981025 RepID=UPI0026E07114|nr:ribosome biogenesis factor YjgA [Sutterella sp.]MDO5531748.1 ribosome biogenesis factor YjgA [Sutterella sp.]